MDWTRPISARVRIVSPLALAATAFIPRAAQAGPTTPQKTDRNEQPAADPLTSLLALAPASAAGSIENAQIAMFADMAAQLAAGEIASPDSIEDEEAMRRWIHASYPILLADPFRSFALVIDRALVGFDVTDLDQTLEVGEPPDKIVLLRGRFDRASIEAAWETHGYQMLDVDGMQIASLNVDAAFDLDNEVQRIALARLNNAAFLPDGTLVYTATLPLMESVLALANGDGESLADRVDIAATLASIEQPLASAVLVSGDSLSLAAQTPVNLPEGGLDIDLPEPMPPIAFGIIGVTPGGPTLIYDEGDEPLIEMPPASIVYRLLMTEPGTAEAAAAVADDRLSTFDSLVSNQPLTELYGDWNARAEADGDILAIDLSPADGRPVSFWIQPLFNRDLLFLAW